MTTKAMKDGQTDKLRSILQELAQNTDMQRRIELCRRALNILRRDANPLLWASLQNDLGDSLQRTFQGHLADNIEESIRCCGQALEVRTRDAMPAEWAATMMNLGNAYSYRIRGDRGDNIEEAIRCYEQALEIRTRDAMPVKWAITMINLGVAYSDRIQGDRAENIEEAVRCCEKVLEVITRDMPAEWAGTMMNLGTAYFARIRGDRADNIEEAIHCYEQALEVRTRDAMPAEWAEARLNLANAYASRIRGDRADNIEEAIRCYEQVLEVTTRDAMPAEWAETIMNLGSVYSDRIRGDRADNIEEAIHCCRQALEVITRDTMPLEWAGAMMNLGFAYSDRIRGNRADNIEKAIHCHEQALEVRIRDAMPVEWAEAMINLGVAYYSRIRGDHADNIEEAIHCYKQVLEVMTHDDIPAEWAGTMMNLGVAYKNRIRGDRADNIEKAIRCQKQVLEVRTRDAMPAEWAEAIINLANAYADRIRGNRAENVEKAIRCYEQALEVRSRDAMPVAWAEAMMNLGATYSDRIRGDRADNIERAIRCFEQTLEVRTRDAMPSDHLRAQRNLGNLCMSESLWTKAAKAFAGVLAANEILYKTSALPESRQAELWKIRGVAARMAYALEKNAAREAMPKNGRESVEVLERNRARWLSEALSLKSGKPETVSGPFWNDFETRRKDYNQLLTESRLPENTPGRRTFLELGAAMRKASELLDSALAKIREQEPSFMPDPAFEHIRSAVPSSGEALIYFAVTPVGSIVFIVRSEGEPVDHIWLDHLLEDTLDKSIQNYLDAYGKWRENSNDSKARTAWFDILDSTLNQLWDWLMGPLTGRLVEYGINRAILIPQGLLGLLPLHAAWTNANGKRRHALDDVCYTYAPNALSLIASRNIAKQTPPERLLAIEEPSPVHAAPLPNANAEVTAICHYFPNTQKVLADEMATKIAVSDALPKNQVFHFSCHGMADFNEPLNSGLLMAEDDILSLRDFLSIELKGARLAVLSACETGIPDIENADEVIGLPAGLVQAGVVGMAASLWSVSDLSTMILMVRFYEFWRKVNLEPPEALRQAQIWMRDSSNGQKAKYFGGFLPEFGKSAEQSLPVHLADMLYKEFIAKNPDENDFGHPFYWAAFAYTGV